MSEQISLFTLLENALHIMFVIIKGMSLTTSVSGSFSQLHVLFDWNTSIRICYGCEG